MKKIFIYSYNLELGGIERSLIGLLESFDKDRYQIDLFLAKHEGELMNEIPEYVNLLPEEEKYKAFGIPIAEALRKGYTGAAFHRISAKIKNKALQIIKKDPRMALQGFMYHKAVIKSMKPQKEKYDVAISFCMPYFYVLTKVNADRKIGFIHTDYTRVHIKSDITEKMFNDIDVIAAVSQSVRQTFIKEFQAVRNKTAVFENVISPEKIRELSKDGTPDMPDEGCIKLLSVGRFCEAKNFDNIPDICRRTVGKGLNVKWYIIGFGDEEKLIRKKINEHGMSDRVIILGMKKNPYPYMAKCDLYVQPSRYEGKAVTVREAQILGKAVAITDFPTSASQLENGTDGIILPLENERCADGIAALLKNKEKMMALAANAGRRDYSNRDEINKFF